MWAASSNELALLKNERRQLVFRYVLIEIKLQSLSSEQYEFFVKNMNFCFSKLAGLYLYFWIL